MIIPNLPMKSFFGLVVMLLAACGPGLDDFNPLGPIPEDYCFGICLELEFTTVRGAVLLGDQPILGQARLEVFFDGRPETLSSWIGTDGSYTIRAHSSLVCPGLEQGLMVRVRYREEPVQPDDPWIESDLLPWVVDQSVPCQGATLTAEDIVLSEP